jgi:periplasmic protein TonB
MTPFKETVEVATPANHPVAAKPSDVPKGGGSLRADAVSLDVPIKVHGTRMIAAMPGAAPQTEPFEEETSTMIVFPRGSVIKMTTAVTAGQMMVVTNLKSGHDAICRIVKVRPYAQTHSYVEIEFTHRQPGYWGVYFPSDGSTDANPAASIAPSVISPVTPAASAEVRMEKPHDQAKDIHSGPAAPVAPERSKVRSIKAESKFAEIGSQEDVQPAASAMTTRADSSARNERSIRTASPAASVSLAQLRGDASATLVGSGSAAGTAENGAALHTGEATHATPFGSFAADSILEGGHAADDTSLHQDLLNHLRTNKQPHNWMSMSLGIAALLITATGGAYLFHLGPFGGVESESVGVPAAVAIPRTSALPDAAPRPSAVSSVTTTPAFVARTTTAPPAPVKAAAPVVAPLESAPVKAIKAPEPEREQPSAPVSSKSPAKVPDMFVALNAHPVITKESNSAAADTAPAVDAAGASANNSTLQGIGAPSSLGPPLPQTGVSQPVRAGGQLKPPRLLSTALPTYPLSAKEAGVEGDIVVDASIDTAGNVSAMKVVSGPPMLRQAALDALRRWKYEPSILDGQPVPVKMTVTIRFHR